MGASPLHFMRMVIPAKRTGPSLSRQEGHGTARVVLLTAVILHFAIHSGCSRPNHEHRYSDDWRVSLGEGMVAPSGEKLALRVHLHDRTTSYGNRLLILALDRDRIIWDSGWTSIQHMPEDWFRDGKRLLVSRFDFDAPERFDGMETLHVGRGIIQGACPVGYDGLLSPKQEIVVMDGPETYTGRHGLRAILPAGLFSYSPDDEELYYITQVSALYDLLPRGRGNEYYVIFLMNAVSSETGRGSSSYWLYDSKTGALRELMQYSSETQSLVSFSPNGDRFAFCTTDKEDSTLLIKHTLTSDTETTVAIPDSVEELCMWSPAEGNIACVGKEAVWMYDVRDATLRSISADWTNVLPECSTGRGAWFPNGHSLLLWSGPTLWRIDLETANIEALYTIEPPRSL